jgi:nicotinamidase-related amidase
MHGTALIIVDMLNDFVLEGAPLEVPDTRKIAPVIKKEINKARDEGRPVIFVCDAHTPDDPEFKRLGWPAHGVKGTSGSLVIDELRPEEGDVVIKKSSYSGFYNTELESTLKKLGVNKVRLTGCVTHICILFIAYEATLRGYDVEVVKEGIAGLAREDHDAALRIMKNVLGVKVEELQDKL